MKKLFLLLLAGGIMTTACKKEEMKKETNLQSYSWKTSDWVLIKKDVKINDAICDMYKNQKTNQIIFEAKAKGKALTYNLYPDVDNMGRTICKTDGTTCASAIIDGVPVWVIKKPNTN